MPRGERLRRTPERQSQAPATVLHVRGYARGSIGEGGAQGGVPDYVACARAVQTVGTLWLLAGMEQKEFVSKVRAKGEQFGAARACVCRKMSQFQHRETSCMPAQSANGRKGCRQTRCKQDANRLQTVSGSLQPAL